MKYEMIEKKSSDIGAQANNIAILTQEDYVKAGEFVKTVIEPMQETVEIDLGTIVKKAHIAHKGAKTTFNKYADPLIKIKNFVLGKMRTWKNEQERKRREEEARLAEKARKEAERLAERARKAEAKGQEEKAEELREQAENREIFKPTVQSSVPKVDGLILRENWGFRVKDASKVPPKYRMLDMVKIGRQVRIDKEETDIPGIEAYRK